MGDLLLLLLLFVFASQLSISKIYNSGLIRLFCSRKSIYTFRVILFLGLTERNFIYFLVVQDLLLNYYKIIIHFHYYGIKVIQSTYSDIEWKHLLINATSH